MRRTRALALAVLLAAAAPAPCLARAAGPFLLVLMSHDEGPYRQALEGFQTTLRERGVTDRLDVVQLDGSVSRAREALQDAVNQGARLVLALGSTAAEAASAQVQIPVVATLFIDPGVLERSHNATGVHLAFSLETEFEWLGRVLPGRARVGVLYNPDENRARIAEAKRVAARLGLQLEAREVASPRDLPAALKSLANRVEILWGLPDSVVYSPQTAREILLFSFRNRIPFVGLSGPWVKAGALYALDRDYRDMGTQCGERAAQLLGGAPAATLPPEEPRRVHYFLNLKTARRQHVDLPDALVRGAEAVYE